MKVSESVQQLNSLLDEEWLCCTDAEAVQTLLNSHEALRLAAGNAGSWLKIANVKPYDDEDHRVLISIGDLRALSRAHQEASE